MPQKIGGDDAARAVALLGWGGPFSQRLVGSGQGRRSRDRRYRRLCRNSDFGWRSISPLVPVPTPTASRVRHFCCCLPSLITGSRGTAGMAPMGAGSAGSACFVAITCAPIAMQSFATAHTLWDYWLAFCWLSWGVLWFLFYLLLAAGRRELTRFTGASVHLEGHLHRVDPRLSAADRRHARRTGPAALMPRAREVCRTRCDGAN